MLSSDGRRRLEQQLIELETVERPQLLAAMATADGKDPADRADRMTFELHLAQVEACIRRLKDLLAGEDPSPTGALQAAATLVLDFGSGPETYRLGALGVHDGPEVITPHSPLGRALAGAVAGQRVTYATPRGQSSVSVVSIGVPEPA